MSEGVDPTFALAVAQAESSFNPNALSPKGAIGIMQLMPATAKALGVSNPWNPIENVTGGVRLLRDLLEKYGSPVLAAAAYHAGEGAVDKYKGVPPYPDTEDYVRKLMQMTGGEMPTSSSDGAGMGFSVATPFIPIEYPETPRPTFLDEVATNPWVQMGLGILGNLTKPGKGAQEGLLAAMEGQKLMREAQASQMDREMKRRHQMLWQQQNEAAMLNQVSMSPSQMAAARGPIKYLYDPKTDKYIAVTQDPYTGGPVLAGTNIPVDIQGMVEAGKYGKGSAGKGEEEENPHARIIGSLDTIYKLHQELDKSPWISGVGGSIAKTVSSAIGNIADISKGIFGTEFTGGETAAQIQSFRTRSQILVSENARDIINQGDKRLSDADRKAAEALQSYSWSSSSEENKAALKTIAEVKWRDYLLKQGVPKEQIYDAYENPTWYGTAPPFRFRKPGEHWSIYSTEPTSPVAPPPPAEIPPGGTFLPPPSHSAEEVTGEMNMGEGMSWGFSD